RIETGAGMVYFKAVSRIYNREIAITRALSEWRPKCIPPPIMIDPRRQWMLFGEVKGPLLAQVDREETWEETLRFYARLQRDSIRFINEHPGNPLFDMRHDSMCPGIDRMLKDLPKIQAGYSEPLSWKEVIILQRLSPRLKQICVEMESYSVPCTLEHGDLHPGNIRITKDGPVFLDWAYSCVTNPFLSVFQLLHERKMPGELRYVRDRLLWTYLKEWLDFTYDDRLKALYKLTEKWRFIQYAVADSQWLSSYLSELSGQTPDPGSYLAWTISRRQYYLIKSLRRILEIWGGVKPAN
ncbi:MAG: phosphotransferase, partial [bacterium]